MSSPLFDQDSLLELWESGSWDSVSLRADRHPVQAFRDGEGGQTTALSLAVNSDASMLTILTIQDLLAADPSQIAVVHPVRGSILHEALKRKVDDDVLEFLVEQAISSQQATWKSEDSKNVQSLLSRTDEVGRVSLHYMVDRFVRSLNMWNISEIAANNKRIFQRMVESDATSLSTVDADGNTPLTLLLLAHKFQDNPFGRNCEEKIFQMVQLLLKHSPHTANIARRLPKPWHFRSKEHNSQNHAFLHGNGIPSPLMCAILHHRCAGIIQLLLDTSRAQGVNSCSEVVTHHRETPLHIAASMNSSIEILSKVVDEEPRAVSVPDVRGFVPLDLVWIRHVMDFPKHISVFSSISLRRYVSTTIMEIYDRASNQYMDADKSLESSSANSGERDIYRLKRLDLQERMTKILPVMAQIHLNSVATTREVKNKHMDEDNSEEIIIPLLHAACVVNCPLALVALAVRVRPESVKIVDDTTGKLPLHYASSRGGYHQTFSAGVTGNSVEIKEASPISFLLSKFPEACRVTDVCGQLPLHIAVDHLKAKRQKEPKKFVGYVPHTEVDTLLDQYPEALHRRDGLTKLYPYQQAAEGEHGDIELAFVLLRRDPILICPGRALDCEM